MSKQTTLLMKTSRILFLLFLPLMFACSSDDNTATAEEEVQNAFTLRPAESCENASAVGYTGAYWDFANARPVIWPEFPTLNNPGQQFIHSQLPLLGFVMPQGFRGIEITDPATAAIGVDMVREDNQVYMRWLPNSFIQGQIISAQDVLNGQIANIKAFYGFEGQGEELCGEFKSEPIAGIERQFSASLIRIGNRLVQAWVITTYVAGGTAITVSFNTAPEAEYATEVANSFLPINYQLYVTDRGDIVDQDGDGFTVLEDPDDTDENVPVNQNGG